MNPWKWGKKKSNSNFSFSVGYSFLLWIELHRFTAAGGPLGDGSKFPLPDVEIGRSTFPSSRTHRLLLGGLASGRLEGTHQPRSRRSGGGHSARLAARRLGLARRAHSSQRCRFHADCRRPSFIQVNNNRPWQSSFFFCFFIHRTSISIICITSLTSYALSFVSRIQRYPSCLFLFLPSLALSDFPSVWTIRPLRILSVSVYWITWQGSVESRVDYGSIEMASDSNKKRSSLDWITYPPRCWTRISRQHSALFKFWHVQAIMTNLPFWIYDCLRIAERP